MSINKVIYNGNSFIDLTEDTVTPETLAEGVTAHDKSGAVIIGTMRSGEDLEAVLTEQAELIDTLQETLRHKASGGGGGSSSSDGIPEGYARCDYIQFSGNQWVDTGIIGNQNTQINVSFTWENSTQRHLFGCASSDNKASITSYMNGSWRFGDKTASKSIATKNAMLPYTALVNKTTISINSAISNISGVNDFETVGTLLLGGARDADGTLPGVGIVGKVYYFFMWQSGEQVRKLVPVVSTDGVYRFFDLISKEFFDSVTDTPLGGGNL